MQVLLLALLLGDQRSPAGCWWVSPGDPASSQLPEDTMSAFRQTLQRYGLSVRSCVTGRCRASHRSWMHVDPQLLVVACELLSDVTPVVLDAFQQGTTALMDAHAMYIKHGAAAQKVL